MPVLPEWLVSRCVISGLAAAAAAAAAVVKLIDCSHWS